MYQKRFVKTRDLSTYKKIDKYKTHFRKTVFLPITITQYGNTVDSFGIINYLVMVSLSQMDEIIDEIGTD